MKVVSCRNCGAKYQLDDNDDIRNYECSACTGDLEFLESYPSTASDQSVSVPEDDLNDSNLIYCTNCGLKFRLDSKENINDFECSSCYGKLRYADEELNQDLDESKDQIDDDIVNDQIATSPVGEELDTPEEPMLRASLKEEFLNNVDKEYAGEGILPTPESDDENAGEIKEEKKGLFKKSSGKNKDSTEVSEKKNNETGQRELVLNPKIKGRFYHDFFIEIGLIIALVGVIDFVLTNGQRSYTIVFIALGFVIFIIGLIINNRHRKSQAREKLVREKLLTLSNEFYVLSYLKLPNAKSHIDHVVIGPTGIFTILTQKYKARKNDKKPSLAIATYSSFKKEDFHVNRNTILNFDKKETKFEENNKVKQKSLELTKNLIEYLAENDLKSFYIEPLICSINKKVSIINIVLTDEDLFLEELLTKIANEKTILDYTTLNKSATLLSEYSAESS